MNKDNKLAMQGFFIAIGLVGAAIILIFLIFNLFVAPALDEPIFPEGAKFEFGPR